MELSVLDLGPIPKGDTATEAFEGTVERARAAERLGYSRFWVAEHHDMTDSIASTTPEVLLGHLAAKTDRIRIGSGTVLLNHYSPYKVAESFSVLDALAPGRVDLGLGRATNSPATDLALQRDRSELRRRDDHAEQIEEVAKHLYGAFPDDHPFSRVSLARSADGAPEMWVLGSSPSSAAIAGELGLRYCFAAFINPGAAPEAFDTYRERFRPSPSGAGPDEPEGMIGVNVTCAETDEEAARLRASVEASFRRLRRGETGRPPSPDEAIAELGGVPDPTPERLEPGEWPRQISGSPSTVRDLLERMTSQVGADEVVVQTLLSDPADTLRSHELIAEGVGLTPRAESETGARD